MALERTCSQLNGAERKHFTRAVLTDDHESADQSTYPTYEYTLDAENDIIEESDEADYDEVIDNSPAPAKTCLTHISRNVVMRIN